MTRPMMAVSRLRIDANVKAFGMGFGLMEQMTV